VSRLLGRATPPFRRFDLIVFDVDGTLTPAFSIWEHIHKELGTWYGSGGGKDLLRRYLEQEIDYFRFCYLDALMWKGQPLTGIYEIVSQMRYNHGVSEALLGLKGLGYKIALVSTGLTVMTDRIHGEFGLDFSVANHLITRNGILTGQVAVNVPDNGKGEVFARISRLFGVPTERMVAVGDSRGDVPMFSQAGCSILYLGSETRNLEIQGDFTISSGSLADVLTILEE
jgi:phosphoserine phosphatase